MVVNAVSFVSDLNTSDTRIPFSYNRTDVMFFRKTVLRSTD